MQYIPYKMYTFVLCVIDLPVFFGVASLALYESDDSLSASEVLLQDIGKSLIATTNEIRGGLCRNICRNTVQLISVHNDKSKSFIYWYVNRKQYT